MPNNKHHGFTLYFQDDPLREMLEDAANGDGVSLAELIRGFCHDGLMRKFKEQQGEETKLTPEEQELVNQLRGTAQDWKDKFYALKTVCDKQDELIQRLLKKLEPR